MADEPTWIQATNEPRPIDPGADLYLLQQENTQLRAAAAQSTVIAAHLQRQIDEANASAFDAAQERDQLLAQAADLQRRVTSQASDLAQMLEQAERDCGEINSLRRELECNREIFGAHSEQKQAEIEALRVLLRNAYRKIADLRADNACYRVRLNLSEEGI